MEDRIKYLIIVAYSLVVAIFPSYILYLFLAKETASLSLVSILFISFLGVLDIILIALLFSARFREVLLLE